MDTLTMVLAFLQEWGALIALLLFIALVAASDVFSKLGVFIHEVERQFPQAANFLFEKEQYVIDCYDRLPLRIRIGFTLIGGKLAWTQLVKFGYAYLRKKQGT